MLDVMSREYCGIEFIVHWDSETNAVYVGRPNNPDFPRIAYSLFRTSNKDGALTVAMEMLKKAFGD